MTTTQPGTKLTVLIHDRDKRQQIITLGQTTENHLRQMNQRGYGVFETINEFSGQRRKADNLTKICAVYADFDVCKDDDNLPEQEREQRKKKLLEALMSHPCPPTMIVVTKNGLQPIWIINESKTDEDTQKKYSQVIEGIIEWSKPHGNLGDPVKDVARVLRKPGFHHMKSEPYLVTERAGSNQIYTLDELAAEFCKQPKMSRQSLRRKGPLARQIMMKRITHYIAR